MKGMQKIRRGTGFRGVLNYTMGGGRGQVIGGNMDGRTPRELASEFGLTRQLRPDIEKPVWHNSLRLPRGERLVVEEWVRIADSYMKRMGFTDLHPRAYILHDDPDGQHIHIVASRVGLDGSIYLGRNENLISTRHIAALELEHGLTITPGPRDGQGGKKRPKKGEIEQALRTQALPARIVIQRAIDQALDGGGGRLTGTYFKQQLAENGILVEANLAGTGRLHGFKFSLDGKIWFKGSSLGKSYSAACLAARGLDFQERDMPAFLADRLEKPATIQGPQWSPPLLDWMHALPVPGDGSTSTIYRWPNGVAAVLDTGQQLKLVGRVSQAKVRAAVEAAVRKGWDSIIVDGEKYFQEAVAREAARRGIRVASAQYTVRKNDDDEQVGRGGETAPPAASGETARRATGTVRVSANPLSARTAGPAGVGDGISQGTADPLGFLGQSFGAAGRPGAEGPKADVGQGGRPAESRHKLLEPRVVAATPSSRQEEEVSTWADWLEQIVLRARSDRAAQLTLERIQMLTQLQSLPQLPHDQPDQAYLFMLSQELRRARVDDRAPLLDCVDERFREWMLSNPLILSPLRSSRAAVIIGRENLYQWEERQRHEISRQAAEEARRQAEREREQQRGDDTTTTAGRERPRPMG